MRTKIDKIIHPTQIYSVHKKRRLFFLSKSVLTLINIGPFSYLYAFFTKTADYWYMPTLCAFTLIVATGAAVVTFDLIHTPDTMKLGCERVKVEEFLTLSNT